MQLSVEFKQKPLHRIGESFSKAGQALQCLDVNRAQCLKAVVDSKRLVEWLRSTIKCKLRHAGESGLIESLIRKH